jgi:hypothetical protein
MDKERTMEGVERLSEAITKYKASLTSAVKLTGKVTEGEGKLWVVSKSSSGSPICVEFKRADVVDVQKGDDAETSTVLVKRDADYAVIVAGVTGHEYDLPAGLRQIFGDPAEAGGRVR